MTPHPVDSLVRLALFFLVVVIASPTVSTFLTTAHSSVPCYGRCRFRFCDATSTILLFANQDEPFMPAICERDGHTRLVSVAESGEARVVVGRGRFKRISRLTASQKFSQSFFKVLGSGDGVVSVAHETAQGNQASVVDGRCFVLGIKRFQIARRFKIVNGVGNKRRDCVAFQPVLPRIMVEVKWDGPDDLDLVVVDPNGEELSAQSNVMTRTGELLMDDGVSRCGEVGVNGREVSVYRGNIVRGGYVAFVKHWDNCGDGARWRLTVRVEGTVVGERMGFSNGDNDQLVVGSMLRFRV